MTAGSESGLLAREVDWESTPIGPPREWPSSLRALVEMCFSTRFPVLVTWGPDLTMIYNDGYRDMLGSQKHPAAMGAPLSVVWKEIWDEIGPLVERVMTDGTPTWVEDQQLTMDRSGYPEETYFTFSYSPLRDSTDVVRGLLDIAWETTEQVVERRRMRLLGDLSSRLSAVHGDVEAIATQTAALLAASPDIAAAQLHLRGEAGGLVRLVGLDGARGGAVSPEVVARVARTRATEVSGRTVIAPLVAAGDAESAGAIVLSAGDRRPWDGRYRSFLDLVAAAVASAVSGTLRHLREVHQLREVSDVLQAAIVPGGSALPGVIARYLPAVGDLAVGGDWYDVVELGPQRRGVVVGDCVGHGLDPAARMGQLRSATRALLLENPSPVAALDGLDRFAQTLPGAECTTVFCGVVDEAAGTLTYAAAGHLPPVLLRADGTVGWLDGGRGASLAMSRRSREEVATPIGAGDLVVLYTDGLIERRGESLREGLARLATLVAAQDPQASEGRIADALLDELVPRGSEDDVALVVYRVGAGA